MRKYVSILMLIASFCTVNLFCACSDDNGPDLPTDDGIDVAQQAIISNYINKVVIPTYKSLADAAIQLAEDCEKLNSQAQVNKACEDWISARKYWELSEAFLFGAASDYKIDPHIDSWPLDLTQLDVVLKAGDIEARINAGTAGYGLLGFHAIEYVIFQEGSTGTTGNRYRDYDSITEEEKVFAKAVSEDMRNQCIRLEAAWSGIESISASKKNILEDEDLAPTLNYGEQLINAGLPGNAKYKTQAAAFEEILVGASDIANEVGNTKIADPMASHQWSDVESPHSWNSVVDFTDNIRSVRNAYYGSLDGTNNTLSVSSFISKLDKNTDQKVKQSLEDALQKLEAMPKPFRNYIYADTDASNKALIQAAVDACNDLVDALDEAQELITK